MLFGLQFFFKLHHVSVCKSLEVLAVVNSYMLVDSIYISPYIELVINLFPISLTK